MQFLDTLPDRRVIGNAEYASLVETLGGPVPDHDSDPQTVIEALSREAVRGVVATAGPRYFGFVTGGSLPVGVAADWMATAWDQNAGLYVVLRQLGRSGLVELVERCCRLARRIGDRLNAEPEVVILNNVVLNQVLVRFDAADGVNVTPDVIAAVQEGGV